MPTRTISLRIEAYERLRRARRDPSESFSDVVMRARWDDLPVTGTDLLRAVRERGPLYAPGEIEAVARVNRLDRPPRDKWKED